MLTAESDYKQLHVRSACSAMSLCVLDHITAYTCFSGMVQDKEPSKKELQKTLLLYWKNVWTAQECDQHIMP